MIFKGANLTGADLSNADLSKADFTGAILGEGAERVKLTGAILVDTIGLTSQSGGSDPFAELVNPDVTNTGKASFAICHSAAK